MAAIGTVLSDRKSARSRCAPMATP